MNKYCFLALKRSGHHAIINWSMNHLKNSYFINNLLEENPNYFKTKEFKKKIKYTDNFFCNIEDFDIDVNFLFDNIEGLFGLKNFFVFRNPFNLIASRLKNIYMKENLNNIEKLKYNLKKWKKYALKFLNGEKNIFLYDLWFTSFNYRNEISKEIGFCNLDKGKNKVVKFGGGSSFDFSNYDNKANQMNVLERYKEYEENNDFLNLFDDEIICIYKKIFDKKYMPKKFKNNITFI